MLLPIITPVCCITGENHSYQRVYIAERIAQCIEQKLPYASVVGVNDQEEIVSALNSVPPPIYLSECKNSSLPTETPLGCLIRGAGKLSSLSLDFHLTTVLLSQPVRYIF